MGLSFCIFHMSRWVDRLRTAAKECVGTLLVPIAIRSLNAAAAKVKHVDDALTVAYNFRSCGILIVPSQLHWEIEQLLTVLAKEPPRRVLEIGTAGGGTFFLLTRVATEDAILLSIDLLPAPFGGGYSKWRGRLIRSFARLRQQVFLLRADSHALETFNHVKELLRGDPLDFLFIDVDHRYEGVKSDFEMYSPLVAKGGLIGFHDIVPGPEKDVGGVPIFWQELKQDHPVREFVADWKQGGRGIGVLVKAD